MSANYIITDTENFFNFFKNFLKKVLTIKPKRCKINLEIRKGVEINEFNRINNRKLYL